MNPQERQVRDEARQAAENADQERQELERRFEEQVVARAAIANTEAFAAIKAHIVEELRPALIERVLTKDAHTDIVRAQGAYEILGGLLAHFEEARQEKMRIDAEGMG